MKKILFLLGLSTIFFASCTNDEKVCSDCAGLFSETIKMYVYEEYVDCEDHPSQQCLWAQLDSTFSDSAWIYFNQDICGFDYEPGFRYELNVERKKIGKDTNCEPLYQYCLVNIVAAVRVYL